MAMSRCITLLAGAILAATAATSATAQSQRAPVDVQKSYDQFITSFRTALKSNDSAAVASMTAFPFYWGEMRDEAAFKKTVYPKVFTRKVRDCIGRERGLYDRDGLGTDGFTIFCGEQLYVFTATPKGFRFTDIGAND